MKQAGTKQGNFGFWMIPFIPQRDYLLPHGLPMALPISSLVLHGIVTSAFQFSARWLISCSSLFRHSLFLHIRVYVGFFNAPSILSLPAAFFYKWQHLDSNRKEKSPFLFLVQPPAFSLQSSSVPFCWSWVNCGTGYGGTVQSHLSEQFIFFWSLLVSPLYLK